MYPVFFYNFISMFHLSAFLACVIIHNNNFYMLEWNIKKKNLDLSYQTLSDSSLWQTGRLLGQLFSQTSEAGWTAITTERRLKAKITNYSHGTVVWRKHLGIHPTGCSGLHGLFSTVAWVMLVSWFGRNVVDLQVSPIVIMINLLVNFLYNDVYREYNKKYISARWSSW